ncbi:hypothetical protein [Affinirhizobium pseudoryzae]|uniref:hypothetical protein n=1 Tax=Allorhizobium pseudoryzae TaxID=379684 RepID=UPI0013ED0258|nr:hypothetical protein [Allorhizobium pseudoryzae]
MGQYPLRVPDYILEQARRAAEEENVSINQFLGTLIAEGLGHRRAVLSLRERAERGSPEAALAILDQIAGDDPDAGDERPF